MTHTIRLEEWAKQLEIARIAKSQIPDEKMKYQTQQSKIKEDSYSRKSLIK
jgi:hypothetical protein